MQKQNIKVHYECSFEKIAAAADVEFRKGSWTVSRLETDEHG